MSAAAQQRLEAYRAQKLASLQQQHDRLQELQHEEHTRLHHARMLSDTSRIAAHKQELEQLHFELQKVNEEINSWQARSYNLKTSLRRVSKPTAATAGESSTALVTYQKAVSSVPSSYEAIDEYKQYRSHAERTVELVTAQRPQQLQQQSQQLAAPVHSELTTTTYITQPAAQSKPLPSFSKVSRAEWNLMSELERKQYITELEKYQQQLREQKEQSHALGKKDDAQQLDREVAAITQRSPTHTQAQSSKPSQSVLLHPSNSRHASSNRSTSHSRASTQSRTPISVPVKHSKQVLNYTGSSNSLNGTTCKQTIATQTGELTRQPDSPYHKAKAVSENASLISLCCCLLHRSFAWFSLCFSPIAHLFACFLSTALCCTAPAAHRKLC